MSVISIDRGVPVAPAICPGAARRKYPFRDMQVGDSFFVSTKNDVERKKAQARLSGCANFYCRILGFTFAVRQVEGGVRVWRVADKSKAAP